jgi:hypothetical protein
VEILQSAGFDLVEVLADVEPHEKQVMDKLAPEFRRFKVDDLFTIRATLVGKAA